MQDFESLFRHIYAQPLAQRRTWYADSTTAYAHYRPPYLDDIIDQACQHLPSASQAHLLELGSGPGNATIHFAQRDYAVLCLEPNPKACEFAKQLLQKYPRISIFNTTFEEWSAPSQSFDAVLAATSFHWLDPHTRCAAIARLLKPQGKIILLYNASPQPNAEIQAQLQPVYEQYAPELINFEDLQTQQHNIETISQSLITSGYFTDLTVQQAIADLNYTYEDYLSLLSTFSPYIALAPERRQNLFEQLRTALEQRNITQIPTRYICGVHIAQVKPQISSTAQEKTSQ